MKRKTILISVLIILLILLFPIRSILKDGGTIEYQSLTYKISKVHRLNIQNPNDQEEPQKTYDEGIIIEIFGFEIYNNVK